MKQNLKETRELEIFILLFRQNIRKQTKILKTRRKEELSSAESTDT